MKRSLHLTLLFGFTVLTTSCGSLAAFMADDPSASNALSSSAKPIALPSASMSPIVTASSVPASGVGYEDMFEAADHLQTSWLVVDAPDTSEGPSRWQITETKLVQSSNIYRNDDEFKLYEGTNLITRSGPWRDGRLSVKIKPTDNDGVGVIFRYQDENNYYRLISVKDSLNHGPLTRLEVKQNGIFRTLAENKTPIHDLNGGDPVQLVVTMSGSELRAEANGQELFTVTDNSLSEGKMGLMTYACSAEFTEFRFGKY